MFIKNIECSFRDVYLRYIIIYLFPKNIFLSHKWVESNDKFFVLKKTMPDLNQLSKKKNYELIFPLNLDFSLVRSI